MYGGLMVIDGKINIGEFVAFNSYIGIIVRPIGMIGNIISLIQRGRASMERITDLFKIKSEIYDVGYGNEEQTQVKNCIHGKIEFKNLSFEYAEGQRQVLKNINLSIEPGKTLGVVGRVGYGKSTLVNLLLRFYNPIERGQLLIDGVDIMDIPVDVLRENVGFVPQDNFLFSQSIKENIAFSPCGFSDEQVESAARISQVYDNIIEFKDEFETILGERGVNISGGQKQRISIARALIKQAPILILDDCLSAVDTATEKKIMDELKNYMRDRTCIIIAHRISTIMEADEIVVLEKGEIIEKGTHQQLLDLQGYYYSMYQRQLLEDKYERN
jgi:ATP-binding cassette subfamily B protein